MTDIPIVGSAKPGLTDPSVQEESDTEYGVPEAVPVEVSAVASHPSGWVPPNTEGVRSALIMTRDGSLRTVDIADSMTLGGRSFVVNYGQGTTSVAGKTALTAAQPDFLLDVPSGTAAMIFGLDLVFAAMAGTANHFFVQMGTGNVGTGTSTAASAGPTSLNQGTRLNTVCTARQAFTVNGNAPGNPVELFAIEDVTAATGSVPLAFMWNPVPYPILVGPACLVGYGVSTTTAVQFKAVLTYAELPTEYAV